VTEYTLPFISSQKRIPCRVTLFIYDGGTSPGHGSYQWW